jgi:Flp pilus assembly protein TadG
MNHSRKAGDNGVKNRALRDDSGQSTIELAVILPFLLLLALGVFEFARALQAKNIVTNISREGTNLASRSTDDPQTIMSALASTAQPLEMAITGNDGMIYITELRGRSDGQVEVVTQYRWDQWDQPGAYRPPSKVLASCNNWNNNECTPTGTLPEADLSVLHLQSGDLAEGQIAYTTEVFHRQQVIFSKIIDYSPEIYSITVF